MRARRGVSGTVIMTATALLTSLHGAQGSYFAKKAYASRPLPEFAATRGALPAPIYDADADYLRCYWRAWEIAFRNFHEPAPGSGYVSPSGRFGPLAASASSGSGSAGSPRR